jgi:putative ABC transport system substrate-binding protein
VESLVEGLTEYGYVDGTNIIIEYRLTEAGDSQLPDLAMQLVQIPVDVLLASGTPAAFAAKQATSTVPIIMISVTDPVRTGLVGSLARPGGNITGLSLLNAALMSKRLELLKEMLPSLSWLAVLANPDNPITIPQVEELNWAAEVLKIQLRHLEVRRPDDFEPAIQSAVDYQTQAFIVPADTLFTNYRMQLTALAARYRLPALYPFKELADVGGLMSYGPSLASSHRQSARYVDKILKGAKPADLPIEQPREFDFVINLKTAQALGLTIPEHVLLQATEVLQ